MTSKAAPKGLKKVVKADVWRSGPARLYLDDVQEIYGLFQRVSDEVTLRLDGYELSSLGDVAQLKSTETKDFEISLRYPHSHVSFETSFGGFVFYIADPEDLALVGLRDAVKEVVHKRRLWAPPFWRYILLIGALFAALVAARPWVALDVAVNIALPACSVIGLVFYARQGRYEGRVILRDSRSTPSFRQANRDLWLVLLTILGTFVATVAGGVVVYIILIRLGLVGQP